MPLSVPPPSGVGFDVEALQPKANAPIKQNNPSLRIESSKNYRGTRRIAEVLAR